MARQRGARTQFALAFESTYGTAPGSGYTLLPFAASGLGAEQPLLDSELLGMGRDPLAPILDAITAGGDITIPMDAEALGFWLKAAFGSPVTTGTDPYTHTFNSGGWSIPSMAIEVGMPDVPHYAMYAGVKLNELTWRMQRSGLLTGTARLIAQGEALDTSSNAGTPGSLTLARFGHFQGSISRNGSALGNIVDAEITYSNNLDPVETIRADGKIEGADEGLASLRGRITSRFADTTLLDDAIAGTPCELEFDYTAASGESFTLTAHAAYLSRPKIPIEGPGGVQVTFDWQGALDTSPARMATAVLVNSKSSY